MRGRLAALAAAALAGCIGPDGVLLPGAPGEAFCEAVVETAAGPVVIDVERDYLPRVVTCENGAAGPAALEAQAIAARSYLYYKLARTGSIRDGTIDQVYSCGRAPGPAHHAAVRRTSGYVLRYPGADGIQVAGFYVAGARPAGPGCRGGADDPTRTEGWVTYNDGRRGADVIQTALGWVAAGNHANRGCMSQHGASCLAREGHDVAAILRFYYGADVAIVQAPGRCVDRSIVLPAGGASAAGGGCRLGGVVGATGVALAFGGGSWLLAAPRARRRRVRRRPRPSRRSR